MAFQFAHVEGYARTAGKGKTGGNTVERVTAEAERRDGACPHIAAPRPPVLLFGVSPSEAGERAIAWAEEAKDNRGHKLRKDGLCLLGGVVSLPDAMQDRWPKFKKDTLKWLEREYGKNLVSVVEHVDEAHPHLHYYAVPLPGERFDTIHDGLRAARLADPDRGARGRDKADAGEARKRSRLAYATAMRNFQDRFHDGVAKRFGLARLGPKRRRMTRGAWEAEQAEFQRLADREKDVAGLETMVSAAAQAAQEAQKATEKIRRELEAEAARGRATAQALVDEANRKAAEWANAKAEATRKLAEDRLAEMAARYEGKIQKAELEARARFEARLKNLTPEEQAIVRKGLSRGREGNER